MCLHYLCHFPVYCAWHVIFNDCGCLPLLEGPWTDYGKHSATGITDFNGKRKHLLERIGHVCQWQRCTRALLQLRGTHLTPPAPTAWGQARGSTVRPAPYPARGGTAAPLQTGVLLEEAGMVLGWRRRWETNFAIWPLGFVVEENNGSVAMAKCYVGEVISSWVWLHHRSCLP